MNKNKALIITLLTCGIITIVSTGFCAYLIKPSGTTTIQKSLNVAPVQLNYIKQGIVTFNPNQVTDKILYSPNCDNVITDDKLVLPFTFSNKEYNIASQELALYSGMLINIEVKDINLYKHLKSELIVKRDFLTLSSTKGTYEFEKNKNYLYTTKISGSIKKVSYFEANDTLKTLNIHLPLSKESSNNQYYISNLDSNPNNENASWKFSLNFDFDLIDEEKGYSEKFNLNHFLENGVNKVKFNISMESYQG